MYRIDNATAITPIPAPAAVGPNPDSFFTKGNPATSLPATILDDDWLNSTQEELVRVVLNAGLTLSKTNRTQLYTAINILIAAYAQPKQTGANFSIPGNGTSTTIFSNSSGLIYVHADNGANCTYSAVISHFQFATSVTPGSVTIQTTGGSVAVAFSVSGTNLQMAITAPGTWNVAVTRIA